MIAASGKIRWDFRDPLWALPTPCQASTRTSRPCLTSATKLCALGAAVTCSLFVTLSGKVKALCSNEQRGLVVCLGAGVMSLTACPDYLVSGVVFQGILPFAAVAGFFGLMCPVLLFGLGSPHLPAGLSTVMAAAELPAGLFIAMVVLGEPLGVVEWLGVVVILAGVCLAQAPSLLSRHTMR